MADIPKDTPSKFNKVLCEVVSYLKKFHPECKTGNYQFALYCMIKINHKTPIETFISGILKNGTYIEKIMNGDDSYFYNNNITIDNGDIMSIFTDFKSIWPFIDEECKAYLRDTMKCLVLLSKEYVFNNNTKFLC